MLSSNITSTRVAYTQQVATVLHLRDIIECSTLEGVRQGDNEVSLKRCIYIYITYGYEHGYRYVSILLRLNFVTMEDKSQHLPCIPPLMVECWYP